MRRSVTVTWRLEEDEDDEEEGCLVETQRFCLVFAVFTSLELRD